MMTSLRKFRLMYMPLLLLIILLIFILPTFPAHGQAEFPTVYAIFFYSPTCSHCHKVIEEDLPVFEAEFGDSLQIIPVNTTEQWGGALYRSACAVLDTQNKCGGVPLMVVGDVILIGDQEIPARLPAITRAALEAGGLPLPEFPGSSDLMAAWQQLNAADNTPAEATVTTAPPATMPSALKTLDTSRSLADRLAADPEANALAVLVLISLLFSIAWLAWQQYGGELVNLQTPALILAALLGVGLAVSLVASNSDDTTASVIAYGVVALLGLALVLIPLAQAYRSYVIPLVALAGIAVASYLTHIETSDTTAVCGLIGDCNTVQQSEYARLFGVLPIGVLGVFAYLMFLVIWGVSLLPNLKSEFRRQLHTLLVLLVLGGALFSAYLTFLEPFVIGATCVWCLTSAVTMLLLLWLIVPPYFANSYFENSPGLKTQRG